LSQIIDKIRADK
jgi:ubiquitin carboxyl-terminal hydrolase 34